MYNIFVIIVSVRAESTYNIDLFIFMNIYLYIQIHLTFDCCNNRSPLKLSSEGKGSLYILSTPLVLIFLYFYFITPATHKIQGVLTYTPPPLGEIRA